MSTEATNNYYERGSLVLLMKQLVDESGLSMFDIRDIELDKMLDLLTEGQQIVFREFYINKKTIDKIAEESKRKKYTVCKQLKDGRSRIIKNLKERKKEENEKTEV